MPNKGSSLEIGEDPMKYCFGSLNPAQLFGSSGEKCLGLGTWDAEC